MTQPIRILIVDDHKIVRKGLRAMLDSETGFDVIGEATNGREAISQVREMKPDVILMDLVMPQTDIDGQEAIKKIKKEHTQTHVLVLTSFIDDEKIIKAIKAGALGYLPKDTSPETLFEGIRTVQRGEPFLAPVAALKLVQGLHDDQEDHLTPREMEVLKQVACGLTNQEIASELVISERTVGTHVSAMLGKLHLSNRVQLALYAIRKNLVQLNRN